ncbi:MAG: hypothetical protein AAFX53_03975 [Bacteroidota bacterium]
MKKILLLLAMGLYTAPITLNAQEPTKMEEVMALHDEVMEKMPQTAKLIGKLQTKNQAGPQSNYTDAIESLRAANKSMVDWMQGFGQRFTADEMMKGKKLSELKQKWLLEEEVKVHALREEIYGSIANAEAVLEQ